MPSRAILTAVAATVAVLLGPTPVRAVNDIPFSITASDGGVVQCLGPWRQADAFCGRKFVGSGTTTTFYSADINAFSPFGPWRCDILKPPDFAGCPSNAKPQVWFCLPKPGPGDPVPSVRLRYSNDVLSVNQPLREKDRPCPATSTSFLGQDGEDAMAATARRSRRSAAADDVDTFDLEADAGETVDVTLAIDGSGGGVGEAATLRVLSGSGKAVLAEDTGPLPLTLQATLDGPASIVVQTATRGEGVPLVPFMGYYTLDVAPAAGEAESASAAGGSNEPPDVAPAAGEADELFPPIFLLVPRGDVEQ